MSDGDNSSLEEIKSYYLNKKIKKKHRKIRSSRNDLAVNTLDLKEKPKKLHLCEFQTSRNVLTYSKENNDNNTINNGNNINFSNFPKSIEKKQSKILARKLTMEKILLCSSERNKKNNNNLYDIYENKLAQSANKEIKSNKILSLQINDHNNSPFNSQLHSLKVKNYSRFRQEKEIAQQIGSLDVLIQSNIDNKNQKKKISNINYPYLSEKNQNTIDNFKRKDSKKKPCRYYPSLKIFNANTERLNLNEERKKNLENEDDELSKKLTINFSPDNRSNKSNNDDKNINNINSYNYKINNINSIFKPTINNVTNKKINDYNTFNKNISSIESDKNFTERKTINSGKKKRYFINLEDSENQKLKKKVQKKFSDPKITCKNGYCSESRKSSIADGNIDNDKLNDSKITIINMKNNTEYFSKTVNKKLNEEIKNKYKLSLLPSNKFLINDEQINEEEKISDKNSDNKENNNNDSKNNSNESYSSNKETTFNCMNYEESESTIKINKKIHTNNRNDINNKNDENKKINNNSNRKFSNEDNEKRKTSENSILDFLKENISEVKDKSWNTKSDDENVFYKKKLSKIKSQLKKMVKESYVFNTCEKEIKNNFLQSDVIEKITKKKTESFGLIFLEEEQTDKLIHEKLLSIEKNKPLKEVLKIKINDTNLFNMVKIFKKSYTQKITLKYKFNLFRVQEILNMYEKQLLKLLDRSWNEINGSYVYSTEMINYICHTKEMSNHKCKFYDKLTLDYCLPSKEKNGHKINVKKLKKEILKIDSNFFKHLEEIQKELHFKTAYLHLRINLLGFKLQDNEDKFRKKNNLNNISVKEIDIKNKKFNKLNKCKISPLKRVNSIKAILNRAKKHHSVNIQSKSKMSLNRTNSLTNENLENDLNNKIESQNTTKNFLFRNNQFIPNRRLKIKHLTTFNIKKEEIKDKVMTEDTENEEKFKSYVKKKKKKLKSTENSIIGFNILKNKSLFAKNYLKNTIDFDKKLTEIFKTRQKIRNFDRNSKNGAIIIKSCGFDCLTREAAAIRTQELENDLPDVKLFEKFAVLIQQRNYNLFEKYAELEGEKFLQIINRRDLFSGNTLLYFAAKNKLLNFMKILLMKGANPNIQNNFGNSPLHVAYKFNSSFMINLLLEYNANRQLENSDGLLPSQMSKFVND